VSYELPRRVMLAAGRAGGCRVQERVRFGPSAHAGVRAGVAARYPRGLSEGDLSLRLGADEGAEVAGLLRGMSFAGSSKVLLASGVTVRSELMHVGGWQSIFGEPSNITQLPVLYHATYSG
jgi:hypothetical protein